MKLPTTMYRVVVDARQGRKLSFREQGSKTYVEKSQARLAADRHVAAGRGVHTYATTCRWDLVEL